MNGVQIGSTKDPLIAFVFGIVTLALAGAYLALYNGFWTVRPWAFTGGFVVAGAGMVTVLAGLLFGYGDIGWALTNILVGVTVMGILLMPSSQHALGRTVAGDDGRPLPPDPETSLGGGLPETDAQDRVAADAPAIESSAESLTEPPPPRS